MSIFGEPNEGIHATRFLGFAVWDFVFTIIAAIIWSYFQNIPIWKTTTILFGVGELAHLAFGVDTAFIKLFK